MERRERYEIITDLRKQIVAMEGFGSITHSAAPSIGLGPIDAAFPQNRFPTGVTHEFISRSPTEAAAASGFMAGLLSRLMQDGRGCLWIGSRLRVFPVALQAFGITPDRVIFVDLPGEKEVLWAVEEALKCKALAAVVGELGAISFAQSRRLQLAVERSRVTGFLHRSRPRSEHTLACVSRWEISSLPSIPEDGMPGVGFPRWQVKLVRVRNGKPGHWEVEWQQDSFRVLPAKTIPMPVSAPGKTVRYG